MHSHGYKLTGWFDPPEFLVREEISRLDFVERAELGNGRTDILFDPFSHYTKTVFEIWQDHLTIPSNPVSLGIGQSWTRKSLAKKLTPRWQIRNMGDQNKWSAFVERAQSRLKVVDDEEGLTDDSNRVFLNPVYWPLGRSPVVVVSNRIIGAISIEEKVCKCWAHHIPYMSLCFAQNDHGHSVGRSRIFPTKGSPRGPGGNCRRDRKNWEDRAEHDFNQSNGIEPVWQAKRGLLGGHPELQLAES